MEDADYVRVHPCPTAVDTAVRFDNRVSPRNSHADDSSCMSLKCVGEDIYSEEHIPSYKQLRRKAAGIKRPRAVHWYKDDPDAGRGISQWLDDTDTEDAADDESKDLQGEDTHSSQERADDGNAHPPTPQKGGAQHPISRSLRIHPPIRRGRGMTCLRPQ